MKEFEYEDEQEGDNADQRCDDSCSINHSETAPQHIEKNGLASVAYLASWSEFDKKTWEEECFEQEEHEWYNFQPD